MKGPDKIRATPITAGLSCKEKVMYVVAPYCNKQINPKCPLAGLEELYLDTVT